MIGNFEISSTNNDSHCKKNDGKDRSSVDLSFARKDSSRISTESSSGSEYPFDSFDDIHHLIETIMFLLNQFDCDVKNKKDDQVEVIFHENLFFYCTKAIQSAFEFLSNKVFVKIFCRCCDKKMHKKNYNKFNYDNLLKESEVNDSMKKVNYAKKNNKIFVTFNFEDVVHKDYFGTVYYVWNVLLDYGEEDKLNVFHAIWGSSGKRKVEILSSSLEMRYKNTSFELGDWVGMRGSDRKRFGADYNILFINRSFSNINYLLDLCSKSREIALLVVMEIFRIFKNPLGIEMKVPLNKIQDHGVSEIRDVRDFSLLTINLLPTVSDSLHVHVFGPNCTLLSAIKSGFSDNNKKHSVFENSIMSVQSYCDGDKFIGYYVACANNVFENVGYEFMDFLYFLGNESLHEHGSICGIMVPASFWTVKNIFFVRGSGFEVVEI